MRSQVGDDDELLEHVLGQDVGVARLFDVVRGDVDVIGTEMQVGGGNGSHPPLGLGRKRRSLVVGRRRCDDLVTVFVD